MAAVKRLVTLVDAEGDLGGPRRMSLSARHEAVLADGRRLLLLGDRGWSEGWERSADIWSQTSGEEIANTGAASGRPRGHRDGRSPLRGRTRAGSSPDVVFPGPASAG